MVLSSISQVVIIVLAFVLPVFTYIYVTGGLGRRKNTTGPLPAPTEITALYVHPIKSCYGISVPSAKLLPTGLDLALYRQWMWVTYPNYEFLTIRHNAKMTLIRPYYDEKTDALTVTAPAPNSADETLKFSIPAHPSKEWLDKNTETHEAKIWNQSTPSRVYPTKLTAHFNEFFGKEVRLVYKASLYDDPRPLRSNGAKEVLGREATTCFPDLMPLLVGNESSINELNNRVKAAESDNMSIDVRRFRPNILVKGDSSDPWDEDRWKTLRITPKDIHGGSPLTFDITQRCARCHVPNVDPETAEKHKRQPWDTLMKYRRVDEGIKYKPCFGMLCVPREAGELNVGDKLEVIEVTDKHRYIAGF
ncbi:MOSC domain-containing protein [Dendryphion nanum]|uniref:MOSC domain-containing protein n=1 Tax=Dendryphion nanum TaxID=256645 RepID=A0A9P9IC61_9PLEO|nr:MOSC domain-containing protein [Dendryphion nanum]